MTEKLLSFYKVRGFSSLLVCFAFIFCRVMTFIRYIGVDFTFGVLDCVRYIKDFVILRFVKSRFHSSGICTRVFRQDNQNRLRGVGYPN